MGFQFFGRYHDKARSHFKKNNFVFEVWYLNDLSAISFHIGILSVGKYEESFERRYSQWNWINYIQE